MKEKAKAKRKKWIIIVLLAVIAAAACVGIYFYQKSHDRASMTAEETMALYMKDWQKKDYDAMIEILYPPALAEDATGAQGMIEWFQEDIVLDVVSIEPDETYADAGPSRFDSYDQIYLRVIFFISSAGGSDEMRNTYLLIQPEKDGAWYIADMGPSV